MDGLIVLLIIIGIVSRVSKSNKKKQEAAKKARAKAFADAADAVRNAKKVIEPARREIIRAVEEEIPFTSADWDAFLKNAVPEKPAAAAVVPAKAEKPAEGMAMKPKPSPEGRKSLKQPLPEGFSPALKSTQGESHAEHSQHVEKILLEEKRLTQKQEELRNLRSVNRQKLREAVIMSEVLGKPVALRGRK